MTIPAAVAPLLLEFPALDRRIWILACARVIVTAGFAAVMPFLAMHLAVERMKIRTGRHMYNIVGAYLSIGRRMSQA